MSPVDSIERRIEQLHLTTNAETDRRILGDASAALQRGLLKHQTGRWWAIMAGRMAKPVAAAAVLLIAVALFMSMPAREVETVEDFYKTLAGAQNICVSEFRPGQTSPDQQVWTSLSLKVRMLKTGTDDRLQFALWDVDEKVQMTRFLSVFKTEPLTGQKLVGLEESLTASFVLAPFFHARDVPGTARWERVRDPVVVALIPGCVVYDLTWIASAGGTERKWRVFADARSHLPRRTELYVKPDSEAQYELESFVVVTYPSEAEIREIVADTFGQSGRQIGGPEYIGTPGIDQ